ncbi:hypothetical protein EIN_369530 [Entamoeba invadens IP1]|uniref:Uncharacterized protein n=1 Tax=Entamoeba invadens IP1 TaxID=370355 RepID=A0A0A1UBM8_ENTIV|nr:hypothetical protein EIN_369530 [Entamoeba invadens IP1]ELP92631.1 hypothetical protein EIN_369530 [Entamoeba invadens IP1]|eukprot:XP_004259402.1 hypothetical protein EIN_369530 [Entamoeba invadens IP1]
MSDSNDEYLALKEELRQLKEEARLLELSVKYPKADAAFHHLLKYSEQGASQFSQNENLLFEIYKEKFTKEDVEKCLKELGRIKAVEDYLPLIKSEEDNGFIINAIAQYRNEVFEIVDFVFETLAKREITTDRKDDILKHFESSVVEIAELKIEVQQTNFSSRSKTEIPKPFRMTEVSPSLDMFRSRSKSPKVANYAMVAGLMEENFKINADVVAVLMNTISLNKVTFLTESFSTNDKMTRKELVDSICNKKNLMVFFYLKRNTIIGTFNSEVLIPGKWVENDDKFSLFVIEGNSVTFCTYRENIKRTTYLGEGDGQNGFWFAVDKAFGLVQDKVGAVFKLPKLTLCFEDTFWSDYLIQKKLSLLPEGRYEVERIGAVTWS